MVISASGKDRSRPILWLVISAAMVILVASAASRASPAASDTTDDRRPRLKSIALSPLIFAALPGATRQLTVTGTYSDGSVKTLRPATETFSSSNTAVATVSSAGVVSVVAGVVAGSTATIGALNKATGIATSASSSTVVTVLAPTLVSIALSPLTVQLPPNATQQLIVTGTYNNDSTQTLAATGELFSSSNTAIATVSSAGIVTVLSGALLNGTATIGVTDQATGISAQPAQSTVVAATLPSSNSVLAATQTALDNELCNNPSSPSTAIAPFYWEIGDQNQMLASGSVYEDGQTMVSASTFNSIGSASKMLYAAYVTQVRGAASNLTPSDISFLTLSSGYTNMPTTDTQDSVCPATDSPDTVDTCLPLKSPLSQYPDEPFGYLVTQDIGMFYYNSGHMEVHAKASMGLGTVPVEPLGPLQSLGTVFAAKLGADAPFNYTEPLMSGGIATTGGVYAGILRNILGRSLVFRDALGIDPVCTLPSVCPTAIYTPLDQEAWSYSIGHWVEDNPATNGDGAFSSAGEFGFYPWIDSTKSYYGIISRYQPSSSYASIQCGRLIRAAFMTGVEQTGTLPNY
jgi:hypothetical protein